MFGSVLRNSIVHKGNVTFIQQKETVFQSALITYQRNLINIKRHYRTAASHLKQTFRTDLCAVNRLSTKERLLQHQTSTASKAFKHFEHGFKTSATTFVHPLLLALIKPLSRIVPMVVGRKLRKWWKSLSDSEKIKFKEAKKKYAFIFGGKQFIS